MHLTCESDNPYIHFVCAYSTFHNYGDITIDTYIENLLVKLLSKVAIDDAQWESWMQVFNRYPLRYEAIQNALGMTLAFAPNTAISVYVKTIILNKIDASRHAVSKCLSTFSKIAKPEVRKMLWETAYSRWKEWNLGLTENSDNIFRIIHSEIDYAVVAYIVECLTKEEIAGTIDKLTNDMFAIDNNWFDSESYYQTAYYSISSKLQLYLHAQSCKSEAENDYLIDSNYYYSIDEQNNDYYKIKLKKK